MAISSPRAGFKQATNVQYLRKIEDQSVKDMLMTVVPDSYLDLSSTKAFLTAFFSTSWRVLSCLATSATACSTLGSRSVLQHFKIIIIDFLVHKQYTVLVTYLPLEDFFCFLAILA